MIVVAAGKFIMGSPQNEANRATSEGPQHEVTLAKPFAVSKFEVTFEEWDACVAAAAIRTTVSSAAVPGATTPRSSGRPSA
jgi:formylglycine-generating enzyme required for sulfatase activity